MKIWKMIGCLALLCVIICGCAILGRQNTSAKAAEPSSDVGTGESDATPLAAANEANGAAEGSVTLTPAYSEGLRFRSNGDGTCAVSGLGTCTSACVLIPPTSPTGDRVTEILPYALQDSIIGAIEIPASVETVTPASFAGCPRLSYVRVAAGSRFFSESDGVLYTADGTTLVYCPAGAKMTELTLKRGVRRILAGAFGACTGLQTVVFPGTTSEWHSVIVGDDNQPLYTAAFRLAS